MVTWLKFCVGVSLLLTNCFCFYEGAQATESGGLSYTVSEIADAIYKAEGGSRTKHPYGILRKYRNTTPRQICINTINHAIKDWNGQGDFIVFLGSRYCPLLDSRDVKGLNKNWVRNVKWFLQHKEK